MSNTSPPPVPVRMSAAREAPSPPKVKIGNAPAPPSLKTPEPAPDAPAKEEPKAAAVPTVIDHLNTQLANAWVLYANYKNYHWQTFGPLFRVTHDLFDDLGLQVISTIDEIAERIRMLGSNVEMVELEHFQKQAKVSSASLDQSVADMIEQAHDNALTVIADLRVAAAAANDQNDPGSVDLFAKTVRMHEKQEWFLRQMLVDGDGLVGAKKSV